METWLIYSIVSACVIGLFWFLQKIEAESSLNRDTFIFYAHLGMLPLWIWLALSWWWLDFSYGAISLPVVLSLVYVFIFKLRLFALKYIDSSTYFINYRIISSTALVIFWQILFWEIISFREYWGIFLGFVVFYLLFERKQQDEPIKDLWKGIVYVVIGAVFPIDHLVESKMIYSSMIQHE